MTHRKLSDILSEALIGKEITVYQGFDRDKSFGYFLREEFLPTRKKAIYKPIVGVIQSFSAEAIAYEGDFMEIIVTVNNEDMPLSIMSMEDLILIK